MQKKRTKKTRRIFWASTIFLIVIATIGWMRFQQALRHWYYLIDLAVWPPPIYFAVSGGMMGILFGLGLIFHLTQQTFTALYVRIISVLLIVWVWTDRIFLTNQDYLKQLLAGTIFITACTLGFNLLFFKIGFYSQKVSEDAPEN